MTEEESMMPSKGETTLNVARALWRVKIGSNHEINEENIAQKFQDEKQSYMIESDKFIRHLNNLGYDIVKIN